MMMGDDDDDDDDDDYDHDHDHVLQQYITTTIRRASLPGLTGVTVIFLLFTVVFCFNNSKKQETVNSIIRLNSI